MKPSVAGVCGHSFLPGLLGAGPKITVEFHDFLRPEQAARVARAKRRLELAGFRRIEFSLDSTDVLFVRAGSLSCPVWFWLRHVVGNRRGLRRHLARIGARGTGRGGIRLAGGGRGGRDPGARAGGA